MSTALNLSVVGLAGARETATPAAVMRTYAAPSGPARASVAVWRTEMAGDSAGPVHLVSEDQVLVVLEGTMRAVVADSSYELTENDSLVLPADVPRQLTAGPDGVALLASSVPGAFAQAGSGDAVPVPWAG